MKLGQTTKSESRWRKPTGLFTTKLTTNGNTTKVLTLRTREKSEG